MKRMEDADEGMDDGDAVSEKDDSDETRYLDVMRGSDSDDNDDEMLSTSDDTKLLATVTAMMMVRFCRNDSFNSAMKSGHIFTVRK